MRLATLDGELTVGVTASDGQVELRTSVPDPSGDGARRTAELSATLGGPTSARPVILRRCGPGCFVGPVQWTRGANTLRVAASAKPWTGGTALFRVPWPPVADSRLLAQVIAAMRAVPKVVVHEAVTSDTAGPSPIVNTNTLTGPDFVSVEPYGKDGTLQVVVVGRDAGMTEIALRPARPGLYLSSSRSADHGVAGEVISTPQHLYTRTFDYPAARRRVVEHSRVQVLRRADDLARDAVISPNLTGSSSPGRSDCDAGVATDYDLTLPSLPYGSTERPVKVFVLTMGDGPDFVSVEPYGKDGTLQVVVVGRDAGMTEIAFALLDQDYYFQLKVAGVTITGKVISTPPVSPRR